MTVKKVSGPPRGFFLKAERKGGGMRIALASVISVSDFSANEILLVSHGGRIKISGEDLSLSVFEGRAIEILGRVKEIVFLYGKN